MQTTVDRLAFTLKQHVRHSSAVLRAAEEIGSDLGGNAAGESLGGVLRNGHLAYLAVGSLLEVVMVKSGARVASCNFDVLFLCSTHITCVAELPLPQLNTCLLAIGLDSAKHGGLVCLFAVHGGQLLRTVELVDKVTALSFVGDPAQCEALGDLRLFDGCLAVGMHSGKVVLLDLRLQQCADVLFGRDGSGADAHEATAAATLATAGADCLIVLANMPPAEMRVQHKNAAAEEINFGVQLPLLADAGAVLCALVLRPLQALAVGLSDGRLVLYTMRSDASFEAFHLAHPAAADSPLLRLALCEPADDPRACVYLWAMHVHADASMAVMHSIMYERKRRVPALSGGYCHQYEGFQSCSVRLQMPLFEREAYPIACQAVRRTMNGGKGVDGDDLDVDDDDDEGESDTLSLCVLAWTSKRTTGDLSAASTVCVFDLNQWYKEQMPHVCNWRRAGNSFLAVFPLGELAVLDVWLDAGTLTPFASQQRPEEHFWPTALNFECTALTSVESCRVRWPGLQNQALELLVQSGPQALLEPHQCFEAMIEATLIPQFSDYHPNEPQTINTKQHFLLSIALEYNCTALLRDCALAWADGSHLGTRGPHGDGLSLSTLTDWMWSRAGATKACCNQLCVPLFDHTGMRLDVRSRQQLLNCTRQLRTLADLLGTVLTRCGRYIPGEVRDRLESQRDAMRMAFEYQEVLQWLLNMGLLPEGAPSASASESSSPGGFRREPTAAVPYPYRALRQFYSEQRQKYREMDAGLLNAKRSCRVLYIDAFIEHQCNAACLRSEWRQAGVDGPAATTTAGDGLYPPASLQAMLRTLLVPGVPAEVKHTLFVYLFLDLSVALSDERFVGVVQRLIKFPAVFRLSPALIKTTQAFWNLDHGQPETAVEELISPLSQERHLLPWQQETLIEALLVQDAAQLALRALRAPRPPIAPLLEIRTLLANNLVAEAFQLQRARADQRLLAELFRTCHAQRKWHFVLDLSLSAAEEQCLGEFLRTCDSTLTENLHFVYLLQRGKYTEAITFVDDLHHNRRTAAATSARRRAAADLDTPSTILAAYKLTMTPASRSMAGMYHSLRDNINAKLNAAAPAASGHASHPHPLSSKLLQHKLDLLGGVYHRSVLCAEQTNPAYWFNRPQGLCSLTAGNVPFLRNPQYDMAALAQRHQLQHAAHGGQLSYAVEYVASGKRSAQAQRQAENALVEEDRAEGPRKRRRVDPAANDTADVMAVLRATTTGAAATAVRAAGTPKQQQHQRTGGGDTLLSTPIVLATNRSMKTGIQAATPQSILKAKPSPPSECGTDALDEKSIRFALPTGESETDEEINMGEVSAEEDNTDGVVDATMSVDADANDLSAVAPTATSTVRDSPRTQRDLDWSSAVSTRHSVSKLDTSVEDYHTPEETPDETLAELSVCVDEPHQLPDGHDETNAVSPPPSDRSKLMFSQHLSPLQRRINLGEGPKPRKRLHSSVSRDATLPAVEPAADAAAALVISDKKMVAARKSKAEQGQLLRRSSRSRSKTPDVAATGQPEQSVDASSSLLSKCIAATKVVTTPLGRKPLSRLVLEANAKKAIAEGQKAMAPVSAGEPESVVVDSSSSSSNNSSTNVDVQPDVAAEGPAVVDSSSDEEHSMNTSTLSDSVDRSLSSNVSSAYLTDDSQRFLDYWAAKNPKRAYANVSRRMSNSSMDDTPGGSDFAVLPDEIMDDSDASFVCNVTRSVESPDLEAGGNAGEEDTDDDVEDVEDGDDDDDDDEVNVEVENAFAHDVSTDSNATTDSDSYSQQFSSSAKSASNEPNDIINISSSSADSVDAAPARETQPLDHKDSSSDDEDDATGANASDKLEVIAEVHSAPSFDTEPGSIHVTALDDTGHFQSANSSATAAQLYGDLEAIHRADDVESGTVYGSLLPMFPLADVTMPVAERFETLVQPEDTSYYDLHDTVEQTTGDLDNACLQIDDNISCVDQPEDTSYSDLHNVQLQNNDTVEQTTIAMITDDDESGALNNELLDTDATHSEATNATTETTTLNHAIICETADATDFAMDSVEDEESMKTAQNTLELESSSAIMDQGGYLLVETTTTTPAVLAPVPSGAGTDDEPSLSQASAEQNLATEAQLEAAVEAMDDEPIAMPIAEQTNTSPQHAIEQTTTVTHAVENRSESIVRTPSRTTSRARSNSIDTEAAPATPRSSAMTDVANTPTTAKRRSSRLRSNSQLDGQPQTPQRETTPVPTRHRGQSEPKQMAAVVVEASGSLRRAASVRRLLQESNVLQPLVESAAADDEAAVATPSTPTRRAAGGRESKQGTPAPEGTPTTDTPTRRRTTRRQSQNTSPDRETKPIAGTPKRTTARSQRAASVAAKSPESLADDDTASVVSHGSRRSTRSGTATRKPKKPEAEDEDDFDDSASVKSNQSTRSTTKRGKRVKALPAIDETREAAIAEAEEEEDEQEVAAADGESVSASSYSNSRRLTRHQISVMERMQKTSDAVAAAVSSSGGNTSSTASRRTERASSVVSSISAGDDQDHDEDDDNDDDDGRKSVQSTRSNRSRRNKKADEPKTLVAGPSLQTIDELDDVAAAAKEKPRPKARKTKK